MSLVNNSGKRTLLEEIASIANLKDAYWGVLKNKTINNDVRNFQSNWMDELLQIQKELQEGSYYPDEPFVFYIRDPKERKISSLKMRDRVVQRAIYNKTFHLFKNKFIFHSYGGIPEKGPRKAILVAQDFCRKSYFYLKSDVAHFYDTINNIYLKKILAKLVKDKKLHEIFCRIIGPKETGIPIGSLLSQYLGNLYLTQLDNFLKCFKGIKNYVRYMDDFIIFHYDRRYLENLKKEIMNFLENKLKIQINIGVTKIDSTCNGVDFLGFRIYPNLIRVKRSNMVRIRRKIKKIFLDYHDDKISSKKFHQKICSYINHLTIGDTMNQNRKMLSRFEKCVNI